MTMDMDSTPPDPEEFSMRAANTGHIAVSGVEEVSLAMENHPVKDIQVLVSPDLHNEERIVSCSIRMELGISDFSKGSQDNTVQSIFHVEEISDGLPREIGGSSRTSKGRS